MFVSWLCLRSGEDAGEGMAQTPPLTPIPRAGWWAGSSDLPDMNSPPGVYDLPAATPLYTANYYDTRGIRYPSPIS